MIAINPARTRPDSAPTHVDVYPPLADNRPVRFVETPLFTREVLSSAQLSFLKRLIREGLA
jgi:hypothetical protein